MADRDSDLPEFRKPPVVEVAIGVQFEELQIDVAQLGLLWAEYRDDYPNTEQHPPIQAMTEAFGPPKVSKTSITLTPTMPVARLWFLDESGTELIQVQPNRFLLNWRKLDTGAVYPRFHQIRSRFVREFGKFATFVQREELGELVLNQSELTYVNHIRMGSVWNSHSQLDRVIAHWGSPTDPDFPPELESASFRISYVIPGEDGPQGRLHVQLESEHFVADGSPLFKLTLIARGTPEGEGVDGALRFLDRGHKWIVNGFTSITSPEMHNAWERER